MLWVKEKIKVDLLLGVINLSIKLRYLGLRTLRKRAFYRQICLMKLCFIRMRRNHMRNRRCVNRRCKPRKNGWVVGIVLSRKRLGNWTAQLARDLLEAGNNGLTHQVPLTTIKLLRMTKVEARSKPISRKIWIYECWTFQLSKLAVLSKLLWFKNVRSSKTMLCSLKSSKEHKTLNLWNQSPMVEPNVTITSLTV